MSEFPTEKELKAEERATARATKDAGVLTLKKKASDDNPLGLNESYLPSVDNKIYEISPLGLELHPLAEMMRLHTDAEREQMRQSFIELGQLVPIVLYKGRVVDGRHRLWTTLDLGLESIMVMKLDSNLTLDEVEEIVLQLQGGRQLTPSEKAIQAYLIMEKKSISMRAAAKKCASSKTLISKVKFIVDILGLKKVRDMYDGKPVSVGGSVATTINKLYNLAVEQDEAERKARSTTKPMPIPEIKRLSQPYIDALGREHNDVVEYVSKWGWNYVR